MPVNSKVHGLYEILKGKGYPVESAVKIAQSKTGKSLATGKPPKGKAKRKKKAKPKGGFQ